MMTTELVWDGSDIDAVQWRTTAEALVCEQAGTDPGNTVLLATLNKATGRLERLEFEGRPDGAIDLPTGWSSPWADYRWLPGGMYIPEARCGRIGLCPFVS